MVALLLVSDIIGIVYYCIKPYEIKGTSCSIISMHALVEIIEQLGSYSIVCIVN